MAKVTAIAWLLWGYTGEGMYQLNIAMRDGVVYEVSLARLEHSGAYYAPETLSYELDDTAYTERARDGGCERVGVDAANDMLDKISGFLSELALIGCVIDEHEEREDW